MVGRDRDETVTSTHFRLIYIHRRSTLTAQAPYDHIPYLISATLSSRAVRPGFDQREIYHTFFNLLYNYRGTIRLGPLTLLSALACEHT